MARHVVLMLVSALRAYPHKVVRSGGVYERVRKFNEWLSVSDPEMVPDFENEDTLADTVTATPEGEKTTATSEQKSTTKTLLERCVFDGKAESLQVDGPLKADKGSVKHQPTAPAIHPFF